MHRNQTNIEYLFLLGGAVALVGALSALLLSSLFAPQPQVHCSFDAIDRVWPAAFGPYDVNINSPTACAPLTYTGASQQSITVDFSVGKSVTSYKLSVWDSTDTAEVCTTGTVNVLPATPSAIQAFRQSIVCNFTRVGNYILRAETSPDAADAKTDIEVGAIIVK